MSDAETAQLVLQSVLDDVVNGRTEGHTCPFCNEGTLSCSFEDGVVIIECPHCRKRVEGILR